MANETSDETSVWNSEELNEIAYVKFMAEKNNQIVITFTGNDPTTSENQFGNKSYNFEVVENGRPKIFGITSKRLMRTLANFTPLDGKTLKITRNGVGMDIDYEVLE